MSRDISRILDDWQFDPDEVKVRIVHGTDGREKLQMRVDLGVLQMELDGRPDGSEPDGAPSWLDHYERQRRAHEEAHPDSAPYVLDEEACARLWREGVQYYHRYLALWHLGRCDLCARDTARNLRLFAFVRAHSPDERTTLQFDQWRPYVTMMHARAIASPLVERGRFGDAFRAIDEGIDAIRDFLDAYGQSHRVDECAELVSLERWREELLDRVSEDDLSEPEVAAEALRRRLEEAVAAEQFEEAARLRDEIRRLAQESS